MNDFSRNGFYFNLFGDFMNLVHNVMNALENDTKITFYRSMPDFYAKYPTAFASSILYALDHELVRNHTMYSEEHYKQFLKEYYVMFKDILGTKIYQMPEEELCKYTLQQMDRLVQKFNIYKGSNIVWQFSFDMLTAAIDEVDRVVRKKIVA